MKIFDKLYDCIAGLGAMPVKLLIAFINKAISFIKGVFKFNKASLPSARAFFKKALIVVLILSLIHI